MWTPLRNDEMLDYNRDALQGHLGVEDKPHHFSRCDLPFPLTPHPISNNTCPASFIWSLCALYKTNTKCLHRASGRWPYRIEGIQIGSLSLLQEHTTS